MNHETAWTIVLFVASLFAPELRSLLKTGFGITRLRFISTKHRYTVLNKVHNDPYQLLIWLCHDIGVTLLQTVVIAGIMEILIIFASRFPIIRPLDWVLPVGMILGTWFSTSLTVYQTSLDLLQYEKAKERLEKRLGQLQAKLHLGSQITIANGPFTSKLS